MCIVIHINCWAGKGLNAERNYKEIGQFDYSGGSRSGGGKGAEKKTV